MNGNVIRTLVPLVISDAELDEAIAVFDAAVASATRRVVAYTVKPPDVRWVTRRTFRQLRSG